MKEEGFEELEGEGRGFYVTACVIHSKRALPVLLSVRVLLVLPVVPAKHQYGKPF